jgi:hypothetical protein
MKGGKYMKILAYVSSAMPAAFLSYGHAFMTWGEE